MPTKEEAEVEDALLNLAYGKMGKITCYNNSIIREVPIVATSDIWYASPKDHDAWLLLKAIESKNNVTIDGDTIIETGANVGLQYHMRSTEDMQELFSDLPEAIENTVNIALRCHHMVKGRAPILPPFACEGGRTEEEELKIQARIGLEAFFEKVKMPEDKKPEYLKRLEHELNIITNMGFPGYFLIVSDFIKWAKANDIPVGPGRGSGAGSLVAYSLTITDLDPLQYGLLFERFLNPERVSMPD